MKKKLILIICLFVALNLIGVSLFITLFFYVRDNPTDSEAIHYLLYESDFTEKYGEIDQGGRTFNYRVQKNEKQKKIPYHFDTECHSVYVYITLEKDGDDWDAVFYEIIRIEQIS